jgi:hypothetical protein
MRYMKWTPEKDALLKKHHGKLSAANIATLLGCKPQSVYDRAYALGITKRQSNKAVN